jgi:hypothetical protein
MPVSAAARRTNKASPNPRAPPARLNGGKGELCPDNRNWSIIAQSWPERSAHGGNEPSLRDLLGAYEKSGLVVQ